MKINWVLADSASIDPAIDLDKLKNLGPFWGGWRTWRSYATDNVVCYNIDDARNLVTQNFHTRCNMYLLASAFQELDRPAGVKLFQGDFHEIVDHPDDIVSMHLAAATGDIVLLVGFDLSTPAIFHDKLSKHKWHNYKQYVLHIIRDNPTVQWVMLDHGAPIDQDFAQLPNLLFDTVNNVLTQFS